MAQQQALIEILDRLQAANFNMVFLQTRLRGDVIYRSKIEPASKTFSGRWGELPGYDPLTFAIEECHKRGMECHAWFVTFPVGTEKSVKEMGKQSVVRKHPKLCKRHNGEWYLDPGVPGTADYLLSLVKEIIEGYDIDGIHIDDYFYPYPEGGRPIPDDREYALYNNGIADRGDWRRYNVNFFVKEMGEHVHKLKPWVKFGVSPFGIYRNKKSSPIGSDTNGLQNYDQLYADVLLWVNNGWIDYCVPQLYWHIGHPLADYEKLIKW